MKVLVCGSRTYTDRDAILSRLSQFPDDTIIISGAARGADTIAAEIGDKLGFTVVLYPAEWGKYGRSAGFKRNLQMLAVPPDLVLAFWDGESRGTAHTIKEAEARNIPVEVIKPLTWKDQSWPSTI